MATRIVQDHEQEMKARMLAGEFGNPVDMLQMNAAWAKILSDESSKHPNPTFHEISGLWARDTGKVAYEGRTSEAISIPMGSKILCFKRESDNEKAPNLGLVWVEE